MQYNQSFVIADEAGTHALAAALAGQCRVGDCILLEGGLGLGKTSFARGFIRALGNAEAEVVSPTFPLLQTYPGAGGLMVWHFDLYRLEAPEDINELGLDEALQSGITLIEWPEMARSWLPAGALRVTIGMGDSAESRHFSFAGLPAVWEDRLKRIRKPL